MHPTFASRPGAAVLVAAALLLSPLVVTSAAQRAPHDPDRLRASVRQWRQANDVRVLSELRDFLAIPNLASDSANIRENARRLTGMLERRGVRARLLESPGSPPAVYGELTAPGATRTVVLYAHYDGQPVDAARWASAPWTPTLRDGPLPAGREIPFPTKPGSVQGEWRLYARSASDDKSPAIAMLAALDALRAAGVQPAVNLKFFFEGEEEAGSAHLREMLTRHRELLKADLWLFADGPVHQSRRAQVVYGVRGVSDLEMTVYGPARALHSGHYGNWAPNPLVLASHLVSSMRDPDGRITIAGFMDDVIAPTDAERRAIAAVPSADSAMRAELLLGGTEAGGAPLLERLLLPALNVRGIQGGATGAGAANAIPTDARVSVDFRLVPRQTPARIRELVEAHVRAQGYHIVHDVPTPDERLTHARVVRLEWGPGYPAVRTPIDAPVARAVANAVRAAIGGAPIEVPSLGGSLPLFEFVDVLGAPVVVLPMVNHDNNQHAANENLRLQNLWDGVELFAGVIASLRW
jgi:acetylornithine deacetylase/succinyl-diaminopimelate desuccinylase-like protein